MRFDLIPRWRPKTKTDSTSADRSDNVRTLYPTGSAPFVDLHSPPLEDKSDIEASEQGEQKKYRDGTGSTPAEKKCRIRLLFKHVLIAMIALILACYQLGHYVLYNSHYVLCSYHRGFCFPLHHLFGEYEAYYDKNTKRYHYKNLRSDVKQSENNKTIQWMNQLRAKKCATNRPTFNPNLLLKKRLCSHDVQYVVLLTSLFDSTSKYFFHTLDAHHYVFPVPLFKSAIQEQWLSFSSNDGQRLSIDKDFAAIQQHIKRAVDNKIEAITKVSDDTASAGNSFEIDKCFFLKSQKVEPVLSDTQKSFKLSFLISVPIELFQGEKDGASPLLDLWVEWLHCNEITVLHYQPDNLLHGFEAFYQIHVKDMEQHKKGQHTEAASKDNLMKQYVYSLQTLHHYARKRMQFYPFGIKLQHVFYEDLIKHSREVYWNSLQAFLGIPSENLHNSVFKHRIWHYTMPYQDCYSQFTDWDKFKTLIGNTHTYYSCETFLFV
ncbi:hypothetical protein RFI_16712 [Reticulomyxa filosa]|uniref:Uncharacterized protein n=1 Tax=Reticulomyxa filosa TaxID=46433 RepID=X6N434_RETFI|nr:hypothetical protein RFI_16712 [Reticulomyxa filosa]|eukprot:ETO20504.1 hypothetical protein RFI_16712 [Reticulomyxa filosa]